MHVIFIYSLYCLCFVLNVGTHSFKMIEQVLVILTLQYWSVATATDINCIVKTLNKFPSCRTHTCISKIETDCSLCITDYDENTDKSFAFKASPKVPGRTCQYDRYWMGTTKESWNGANKKCKNEGAHLAYLETKEEWQYLRTIIQGTWNSHSSMWVGARKRENGYQWLNGKEVQDDLWAPQQPYSGDPCVSMWYGQALMLDDIYCDTKYYYVCEIY